MKREDVPDNAPGLTRLRERATALGWRCLATAWHGNKAHYAFECTHGHRFGRQAGTVLRHSPGCPVCKTVAIRQRFYARLGERGFTCLEADYLGSLTRHRFRCESGHEWTTPARKVMEGHGCPACARAAMATSRTRADGLERMQQIAADHGGRCLAQRYEGTLARYEWECTAGHRWQAMAATVVKGHWCRRCAVQRESERRRVPDGMQRLRAIAASHGGKVLETCYASLRAKYTFRCAQGHEWQTRGDRVLGGSWCRVCVGHRRRLTIGQMQEIAQARGGRCLSHDYLGNQVRLTWECHLGHVWQSTPLSVKHQGTWCPNCARLRVTKDTKKRLHWDYEGQQ